MRLRLLAPALLLAVLPHAADAGSLAARVDPGLLSATGTVTVFLHAGNARQAERSAAQAGLRVVETYRQVGIVVASGLPSQVRQAAALPGVTYLENADTPIALALDHANRATRNSDAQRLIRPGLSGAGVSIAIVDSGIDGTHPFLQSDGKSKVVANLKDVCTDVGFGLVPNQSCWVPVIGNDSDTASAGGHGTHVAGIAAGVPTRVTNRLTGATRMLSGAAPGASLVGLSIATSLKITGGTSGMNWVLDHHAAPCGSSFCPPIRVVNNSWGPVGGSTFDPHGALAVIQRALVAQGVVVVWAAGNDGGDGSGKDTTNHVQSQTTNGPGNDPTPGVLMVAAYDDGGTGGADAALASYSSRGVRGHPDTYPDVSAPGSNILSSCRPYLEVCSEGLDPWDAGSQIGAFNTLSGTSMATPFVAGVAAELLALDPSLRPADVEQLLEAGAHRFGDGYEPDPLNPASPTSFDKGHGLIDVLASADLAQGRTARRQSSGCATFAWQDESADANGFENLTKAGPSHPEADLRAGHWEWDGLTLTAVFVLTDISPNAWRAGDSGTYVNWQVLLGTSQNAITIVGGVGGTNTFYVFDSNTASAAQPALHGQVIDRPGEGSDEIRISLTNADLAALNGGLPPLGPHLRLTTLGVIGGYDVGPSFIEADAARAGCPTTLS